MSSKKYTKEFKDTVVELYNSGKPSSEIISEYGLNSSCFYKWVKERQELKIDNNQTVTASEVSALHKELAQMKLENEILKKALTIFAKN